MRAEIQRGWTWVSFGVAVVWILLSVAYFVDGRTAFAIVWLMLGVIQLIVNIVRLRSRN